MSGVIRKEPYSMKHEHQLDSNYMEKEGASFIMNYTLSLLIISAIFWHNAF